MMVHKAIVNPDDDFYVADAYDRPLKDRFILIDCRERKPDRYK